MKKLRVFKWWWGWNYQEIENWLEKMASDGYRLTDVTSIGVIFSFEKTELKKVRYCIDYQQSIDPNYTLNLKNNGWDVIKMGAGWYICRKEYESNRPEISTDLDCIITRNHKLMFMIIASGLPFFIVSPIVLMFINISIVKLIIVILWLIIFLFDIFVIINLRKTTRAIMKKKNNT